MACLFPPYGMRIVRCFVPLSHHRIGGGGRISECGRGLRDGRITIHVEATDDPAAALRAIRDAGVRCCISIKPATPTETILPYLSMLDMVLVMSVEPGFGGQKFMPDTLEHVRELVRLRSELGLDYDIEIDGGINRDNIKQAVDAGVNVVVAGSAIFGKPDIAEAVRELREAAV